MILKENNFDRACDNLFICDNSKYQTFHEGNPTDNKFVGRFKFIKWVYIQHTISSAKI